LLGNPGSIFFLEAMVFVLIWGISGLISSGKYLKK
jgi:hypothetical protein